MNHGDWDILNVVPKNIVILDYWNDTVGKAVFHIIIKRNPVFHTVNLILPSMLLMIINMAGFYIPPESGERISFKVTLLLGYSVFLIIVSEQSPPSGTPLIGSYFMICMVLLTIGVMESVFIVHIVNRQHLHRSVPKWVRILVLEKMMFLLCLKDKDNFTTLCNDVLDITEQKESSSTEKLANCNKENIRSYDMQLSTIQDTEELIILKEMLSIQESKKNTDQCCPSEWLRVGYIIDTFLFRLYIIVVFVCIVSMVTLWAGLFHA